MSAIERVMKAYASKHDLSERQAAWVRLELSAFITELKSRKRREPTMLPERKHGAAFRHLERGTLSENSAKLSENTGEPAAGNVRVATFRT